MENLSKKYQKFLGEKIRSEREKLGISQEEFGERVGVHRTYVGMIERGEKNVTLENMVKFSSALNMRLKDLIDF